MVGQLIRFGGVGGLATLIHVAVAMLLSSIAEVSPLQANFAGFASALMFSYVGHARCTFRAEMNKAPQFLRFIFVALVALATSSGTVLLVDTGLGLDFGIAMAAVAVLVPAVTYLALRFWVFEATSRQADMDWLGLGLSTAFALATLVLFWGRMINHDTAWYLVATREWLGGAGLYTDLIEVNPPLNFYFTLPAIGLADLFGISDTNGEVLALALLIFLILYWCNAIIRDVLGFSRNRRLLLVSGIALAMVVPALKNFGQREQVMVILAMPWLLGELASAPANVKRQIGRAVVAALGICLKPHFALIPVAVAILNVKRQRSFSPLFSAANLTFLVVGLSYVGLVALLHPAYFSDIVPIAREIYGAYAAPFSTVLSLIGLEILLVTLPALAVLSAHVPQRQAGLFGAAALAGLGIYFLQGTGFSYHSIPFHAFALCACCFVILNNSRINAATIAAVFTIVGLLALNVERGFYRNDLALEIAQVAQDLGKVESLIVLSTNVSAGPPAAIASGARWASHYPANWLVPGALNRLEKTDCTKEPEICARLLAIAARNRSDILTYITVTHPDLLVLDMQSGYFDHPGFTWEVFMAEDPVWLSVFSEYSEVRRTERFVFYQHGPSPGRQ